MKRFIVKILIFCSIIILIDFAAGFTFSKLVENAKGGDNWRNNNIAYHIKDNILIFGSSRAIHHYNPKIIEDSLGVSCYNCGQDGNGIVLSYARIKMLQERYNPKMIVFDVTYDFDLKEDDKHRYLGWIKPYYDDFLSVRTTFEDVDPTERYKMLSNLYQYNSKFLQILSDAVYPMQPNGYKGYRPVQGIATNVSEYDLVTSFSADSLKMKYWEDLMDKRGEIKYVFVVSPTLAGRNSERYKPLKDLCEVNGVDFHNMANDPKFVGNLSLFYDGSHLNSSGADLFTKKMAGILLHGTKNYTSKQDD